MRAAASTLTFEIGNPLRVLVEQFPESLVLVAQPLDFVRLTVRRVARRRVASRSLLAPSCHRRERTKSLQKVQVKMRAKPQRA